MDRSYLFNTEKIKYVKGGRPDVDCILCAICRHDPRVKDLTVYSGRLFTVALNLYPFNPGHLMIFPNRHVCRLSELTTEEAVEMHRLLVLSIGVIDSELSPSGYNTGYNLGCGSGASIPHLHQHVVPRYDNEVGFLDVLSGTRVMVSDPVEVLDKLSAAFRAAEETGNGETR
ncbi:MAG: HIT domain-containing protein [Spirochaetes bacterium]|nr:HIT domain-containing protein [Spirochaetota bacterium]